METLKIIFRKVYNNSDIAYDKTLNVFLPLKNYVCVYIYIYIYNLNTENRHSKTRKNTSKC